MDIQYTHSDSHHISVGFNAKDLTPTVGYRNYSYRLFGSHDASDLDLDSMGSVGLRLGLYEINTNSHYKRGYLSRMEGHVIGKVDVRQKEVILEVY